MKQEREDLLSENKSNNTTSAYEKTGMYPFDPDCFAWTEAMDNVGLTSSTQRDYKRQVSYEIYANETCGLVELSPDEKKTLRDDMDLDEDLGLPDQIVATLRGHTILKKWRQKVDEMSVEGNEWVDMAKSYLPLTFADEDGDKIAMRLVHFIQVGQQELKAAPPKTKEEKRCEAAIDILRATCETSAVKIQYVPDKIHGTAVKLKDAMWMVFLRDDRNFTVNQIDLLDPAKYEIIEAAQNLSIETKRKHQQKQNRQRARDELKLKEDLQARARKLREQNDLQFYQAMLRKQQESSFGPEEFLSMVRDLRRPFCCEIDGRPIEITELDCAMMMRNEVTDMLTTKVLVQKRKDDEENNNGPNKRRRTGGNAAVNTVSGACCFTALQQTSRRDRNSSRKEREAKRKKLVNEDKEIKTMLEAIQRLKEKFPDNTIVGNSPPGFVDDNQNNNENEPRVANLAAAADQRIATTPLLQPVAAQCKRYWDVSEQSSPAQLKLILRMFAPGSGLLSKGRDTQWSHIKDHILGDLTKLSFDAKHESLGRRLLAIEKQLQELEESEKEDDVEDDDEDVNEDVNELDA